jgi:hypothetical protein
MHIQVGFEMKHLSMATGNTPQELLTGNRMLSAWSEEETSDLREPGRKSRHA